MNIQTKFSRTVRGMLTKITVIALMVMIGVIVNINDLAVDYMGSNQTWLHDKVSNTVFPLLGR